jgi:hypothetical protein
MVNGTHLVALSGAVFQFNPILTKLIWAEICNKNEQKNYSFSSQQMKLFSAPV